MLRSLSQREGKEPRGFPSVIPNIKKNCNQLLEKGHIYYYRGPFHKSKSVTKDFICQVRNGFPAVPRKWDREL
jgi:hypothetical protein